MKCTDAEKQILLKDSGELPAPQAAELARHLATCNACSRFEQMLRCTKEAFSPMQEPAEHTLQAIFKDARQNAPQHTRRITFPWKPALAIAASLTLVLSLFTTLRTPGQEGMELVISETDLLNSADQVLSVMYDGLSEDDLAFNFLMTYEGDTEG